jgi:NAD(P)-dependent dehydrogenase (short-subunit alcohol dehydrogenase family)
VALVTGAAQGIGAGITGRFLEEGASAFLADVQACAAADVPEGARTWFVRLDVTRESDWAAAFAEVRSRAGPLEVLVNNAGVNSSASPSSG